MKFVCNDCRQEMKFVDNKASEDSSSMAISYSCPTCGRGISMITNAGETQMVHSLGVTIGHEALDASAPVEPMSFIRDALDPRSGSPPRPVRTEESVEPEWTESALKRLSAAPAFVQGMIRRLYTDYAVQKGYTKITPAVMTEARDALGLTGM